MLHTGSVMNGPVSRLSIDLGGATGTVMLCLTTWNSTVCAPIVARPRVPRPRWQTTSLPSWRALPFCCSSLSSIGLPSTATRTFMLAGARIVTEPSLLFTKRIGGPW